MSKRLEDFIKTNREEFDEFEPSVNLWVKIEQRLPIENAELKSKTTKTFSLQFVMRVAASIIIVMGVCFVLYLRYQHKQQVDYASINPVYAKQQIQYASLVETKRNELKTIAKTDPQLYKEFSAEIAKMDSTYKKLNNDLATSPNQELVLRAMIRNLQIQTEVLNQQLSIIEQFNATKKTQNNETKNI